MERFVNVLGQQVKSSYLSHMQAAKAQKSLRICGLPRAFGTGH